MPSFLLHFAAFFVIILVYRGDSGAYPSAFEHLNSAYYYLY